MADSRLSQVGSAVSGQAVAHRDPAWKTINVEVIQKTNGKSSMEIGVANRFVQDRELEAGKVKRDGCSVQSLQFGRPGSLKCRTIFLESGQEVSPWHRLPLQQGGKGLMNYICKTPAGSWVRHEIAQDEPFNPLRVVRGRCGRPARYADNCPYNLGVLPQTWADPKQLKSTMAYSKTCQFDGRPMEVLDIGEAIPRKEGDIYLVKPLAGFLVVEESNALSWKIVAIAVDDPLSKVVQSLADLTSLLPDTLSEIRGWLQMCLCTGPGMETSVFPLGEQPADMDAVAAAIAGAHAAWKRQFALEPLPTSLLPPGTTPVPAELEKAWAPYTSSLSADAIPRHSSEVLYDRAWGDVAREEDLEQARRQCSRRLSLEIPSRAGAHEQAPRARGGMMRKFWGGRAAGTVKEGSAQRASLASSLQSWAAISSSISSSSIHPRSPSSSPVAFRPSDQTSACATSKTSTPAAPACPDSARSHRLSRFTRALGLGRKGRASLDAGALPAVVPTLSAFGRSSEPHEIPPHCPIRRTSAWPSAKQRARGGGRRNSTEARGEVPLTDAALRRTKSMEVPDRSLQRETASALAMVAQSGKHGGWREPWNGPVEGGGGRQLAAESRRGSFQHPRPPRHGQQHQQQAHPAASAAGGKGLRTNHKGPGGKTEVDQLGRNVWE